MGVRNYSNTAASTTLTAGVSAGSTVLAVDSTTGFPAVPFHLTLAKGEVTEEIVLVTAAAGSSLTVSRGVGGTSPAAHDPGTTVDHTAVAADLSEPNQHVNASANVHGLSDGDTVAGAASVAAAQAAAQSHADTAVSTHAGLSTGTHGVGALKIAGYLPGEIKMYGGSSAPSLWLLCNGSAVSRSTYSDLFAVVGTSFGAGDGSTTFNLPDFSDRVPMGGGSLGAQGGANSVTLTEANLAAHTHTGPSHTHTINHDHPAGTTSSDTHTHTLDMSGSTAGDSVNDVLKAGPTVNTNSSAVGSDSHSHSFNVAAYSGSSGAGGTGATGSTGSGTAVDTTPAHQRVNFIIYAGV